MAVTATGLLDTSVVIALAGSVAPELPDEAAVSTMTLAELRLGAALAAANQRPGRLAVLAHAKQTFDALPVDRAVAGQYGELVASMRRAGQRPGVADALIAATALAHDLALYTLDEDFRGVPGLRLGGI